MRDEYVEPIRMAVCDDDPKDREIIIGSVEEISREKRFEIEITAYERGEELLEAVQKGSSYQIYLLDVMMAETNGMDVAAQLRRQNENAPVIFISSNREMAMLGYEVDALRYLSKPVDPAKLTEALTVCCEKFKRNTGIFLTTARGKSWIYPNEILYVESWNRGVRVTCLGGQIEGRERISDLYDMLPKEEFIYCHRAVLINLAYVAYVRYGELELKTGTVLPVSKYRLPEIKKKLLHYLSI